MTTATANEQSRDRLPPLPELALRVAFAGTRNFPNDAARERVTKALESTFDSIADCLTALAADALRAPGNDQRGYVIRFYDKNRPLVRVITGLAEDADALAADVASRMKRSDGIRWRTAAVLAFPRDVYRDSRRQDFQKKFTELLSACEYVVELDGIYEPGDSGRQRRSAAYRAQSAVLLRQADLLIAVADAEAEAKAGGTLETLQTALDMGLPCVFIDVATGKSRLLGP